MAKDLGGVVFNDYSAEVLNAMNDAVVRALERCGSQAEGTRKTLHLLTLEGYGTVSPIQ